MNYSTRVQPVEARGVLWAQDSNWVKSGALSLAREGKLVEAIDRVITGYVERTDDSPERKRKIKESATLRNRGNLNEKEVIEFIKQF